LRASVSQASKAALICASVGMSGLSDYAGIGSDFCSNSRCTLRAAASVAQVRRIWFCGHLRRTSTLETVSCK
jgi:hypothetical protein